MKPLTFAQLATVFGGSDPISQPLSMPLPPPVCGIPAWVNNLSSYLKYIGYFPAL